MHEHNIIATEQEIQECRKVIDEVMKQNNYSLSDKEIDLLTLDILNTISSLGGDFSKDVVKEVANQYIQSNFYQRFKEAHRDELGPTFKY